MRISVECYAGGRADERPTAIVVAGARMAVEKVIDAWYGEDHLCFRVRVTGGDRYLVRRDDAGEWTLAQYDRA